MSDDKEVSRKDYFTEIVAQLWCLPQNQFKEMDVSFAEDIVDLLLRETEQGNAKLQKELHQLAVNFISNSEDYLRLSSERNELQSRLSIAEAQVKVATQALELYEMADKGLGNENGLAKESLSKIEELGNK